MSFVEECYKEARNTPSDIYQHIPRLYDLALICTASRDGGHITELGWGNSTFAFLRAKPKYLCSYDLFDSHSIPNVFPVIQAQLAEEDSIFKYEKSSIDQLEIEETDLLFIDIVHTYDNFVKVLYKYGHIARYFIVIHDVITYGADGELPNTKGIWPAICEYIRDNPQWKLSGFWINNNGLIILTNFNDEARCSTTSFDPQSRITAFDVSSSEFFDQ